MLPEQIPDAAVTAYGIAYDAASLRAATQPDADPYLTQIETMAIRAGLAAAYPVLAEHWRRQLDDTDHHVIDVRADGWTIQHPLACRLDLFACPVNRAAGWEPAWPPAPPGRYRCGVDEAGELVIGKAVDGG